MRLEAALQARGVSPEALAEARRRSAETGRSAADILVEMGVLQEQDAARAEAEALGV